MENWAYGFNLNHEGAGVGTIYYSKKYFERNGIVNPTNAVAYSAEEIDTIKNRCSRQCRKFSRIRMFSSKS